MKLTREKVWLDKKTTKPDVLDEKSRFYVGTATKKFSCSQLTLDNKVELLHDAMVKMEPFAGITSKFNVKPMVISYLVGNVRKNPEYVRKMINAAKLKEDVREHIHKMALQVLDQQQNIPNCHTIVKALADNENITVHPNRV